jgi:transcriptional repressor NrdR
MKCPFCGHLETQVVETRMSEDGDSIRRRRQCGACEKRYTTYERPDVSYPNVVKKDGIGFAQTPREHRAVRQCGGAD